VLDSAAQLGPDVAPIGQIENLELSRCGFAPFRIGIGRAGSFERGLRLLAFLRALPAAPRVERRDSGQSGVESTRAIERECRLALLGLVREHESAIELRARVVRILALRAVELRARGIDLVEVVVGLREVH